MILVNNLCDFHDLYSYFTLCNVCYVFQRAKSRHFTYIFFKFIIKEFNHIHDKEVLQLSPLTFEFSVWLDHNGGIN